MTTRLTVEERRARDEEKAIRSLAYQARRMAARERREAQQRFRNERLVRSEPSVTWVAADPAPPPIVGRRARKRRSKGVDNAPTLMTLVEPAARAHGDYAVETLTLGPCELEPGTTGGTVRVLRNRGGTTVERWLAKGAMTVRQMEGIAMFARLHRLRYDGLVGARVVANWSLAGSFRGGTIDFHEICARQADAKKLLDFLDEEVLFRFGLDEQEIFRNVVLHDEPAGVAGGRLGYRNDRAEAAAKVIVLMIADQIADALALGRKRRAEEWCKPARA